METAGGLESTAQSVTALVPLVERGAAVLARLGVVDQEIEFGNPRLDGGLLCLRYGEQASGSNLELRREIWFLGYAASLAAGADALGATPQLGSQQVTAP